MSSESGLSYITYQQDSLGTLNLAENAEAVQIMFAQFAVEALGADETIAEESSKKSLAPGSRVLGVVVALDKGKPIGYATLRMSVYDTDGTLGVFSDAYIDPNYRRKIGFLGNATDSIIRLGKQLGLKEIEAVPIGIGYAYHMETLQRRGFKRIPNKRRVMRLSL